MKRNALSANSDFQKKVLSGEEWLFPQPARASAVSVVDRVARHMPVTLVDNGDLCFRAEEQ